jgi:beta-glucosidase
VNKKLRMMTVIGFCLGTGVALHAQINITGTVKDANGNGIAGATVALTVAKKSATTAANGSYAILGTAGLSLAAEGSSLISAPFMKGGLLYFGVKVNGMQVRLDMFTLAGRHLATVFDKTLATGNYKIDPVVKNLSSQICCIKLQAGKEVTMFSIASVHNSTNGAGTPVSIGGKGMSAFTAKTSAALDTLVASAPQYKIVRLPIDNYTGTYNFTLEKAPFSLASPDSGALMCDSRRIALSWNPLAGAVKYEVWLNIWAPPYDNNYWMAYGSLLDRYTKVGETAAASFTTDTLADRWTYKWYVVAVDALGGKTQSNIRQFGVYLPVMPTVADGIKLVNGCRDLNKNGTIEPFENWRLPVEARVKDLMSRMTRDQKILQMFYDADGANEAGWAYFWPLSAEEIVTKYKAAMATPWSIPFITAGDEVHGFKITYPAEPGLAAMRNFDLVYKCGDLQRRCHRAISGYGNLAPLSEIGTCVFYDRVQEGCGEDGDVGAAVVRALLAGYHNGPEINPRSMLETLKHWPSQGAGGEGQVQYDWVTIKYHIKPWKAAMDAGVGNIMAGYASCPLLATSGLGVGAGDNAGIIAFLRDSLHYDGVLTTDWLPGTAVVNAALAGSDVMGGNGPSYADAVGSVCSDARINDAARRILTVKFKLGMFENPYPPCLTNAAAEPVWQNLRNEGIHVEAARQSLTLLKNNGVLPLKLANRDNIVVGGAHAESENGTYAWYSGWNNGKTHFFDAIQARAQKSGVVATLAPGTNPKVAICIVGEPTYSHRATWGATNAFLPASDLNELKNYKAAGYKLVVIYLLPRPYVIPWEAENADAIVAAYRCGDGGPQAVAEMLFGDFAPRGKLSWQMPKSLDQMNADKVDLPFDMGATAAQIAEIRQKIDRNERVEPVYGDPLFQQGMGLTW